MNDVPFTTVTVDRWTEVRSGLRSVLDDFERRVIPVQGDLGKWDYVRVELWADSGRFIVFPARADDKFRVDVTGAQLVCREIEEEMDRLNPDSLDFDDAADGIHKRMIAEVVSAFEKTCSSPFQVWDPEKRIL